MNVLVFNAGSSSFKFQLQAVPDDTAGGVAAPPPHRPPLIKAAVEQLGTAHATLELTHAVGAPHAQAVDDRTHADAAERAIRICQPLGIDAVGHRVVHGGPHHDRPVVLTPGVVRDLHEWARLAPLHNEAALQGIGAAQQQLPDIPAVAVFDTAFHHDLPEVARLYALPHELSEQHHLRRYGFHGTAHRSVSQRLLRCLGRDASSAEGTRLITCHLGSGASVCAVRDGRSVDTSMGLTPLAGLVMGTRCGDIDPGLVLFLIRSLKMSAHQVNDLLNHRSGLRGLSGISGDTRRLEQAQQEGHAAAARALDMFAYRVRQYIGSYAAVLNGVDAIAFSGGIGENSPALRSRICDGLSFLGLTLEHPQNIAATGDGAVRISSDSSRVQVWRIPAHEEHQIAIETCLALSALSQDQPQDATPPQTPRDG